jgi:hypothetical protein
MVVVQHFGYEKMTAGSAPFRAFGWGRPVVLAGLLSAEVESCCHSDYAKSDGALCKA